MVGENAVKYPHLLEEVRRRGHQVGNHTYNHMSGMRHFTWTYLANIKKADEMLIADKQSQKRTKKKASKKEAA